MNSKNALAEVWVLDLHTLDAAEVARCDKILSSTERARMQRFHFKEDCDAYRAAHALARIALSACEAAVPPHAWEFEETSHGRPEISPGRGFPGLRFNISHTRDVVACIVTRGLDCGVDVESMHRYS